MASQISLLIAPIPAPSKLLVVNSGVLKPLGQLPIKSAIDKTPRRGRVHVSTLGLAGDEHDMTFHGGEEKALHQYCLEYYSKWHELYPDPDIKARFIPGGFGENLAAEGFSDANVCIGDVVRIGWPSTAEDAGEGRRRTGGGEDGSRNEEADVAVLLEVSQPRQPCFKLNSRFGIKNFAKRTIELSRTGWYYRVLREGWIEEGMEVRVIERKHPRWTIEALQHYTHRELHDRAAAKELVELKELAREACRPFQRRLEKMTEVDDKNAGKATETWRDYEVVEKHPETRRIMQFVLKALQSSAETKKIEPGSHVRVRLANGLIRAYSVVDGTPDSITICVALADHGRGGSQYLHSLVQVHDVVSVGKITASIPLASGASNHILIAGGVGITAFMAAVSACEAINLSYELHYAVRSNDDVAFARQLEALSRGEAPIESRDRSKGGADDPHRQGHVRMSEDRKINIYDKSKGQRMNISEIVEGRKWNSHVYVCGPQRMTDAAFEAAREFRLPGDELHYEAFQAVTAGEPFTVEVLNHQQKAGGRKGGDDRCVGRDKLGETAVPRAAVLQVGAEQTLLEVLRAAGFDVASSCEAGNCGTCRVAVSAGRVEHRGGALGDDEKSGHRAMLACVSRGLGHISIELD